MAQKLAIKNKGAASTDTWLTPPEIIRALGPFDLDPCTPPEMPWPTAAARYTEKEDGLTMPWYGRVWLNPPYGNMTGKWLCRLVTHGNGIAMIFARTETATFFKYVWDKADGVLFLQGRITFYKPDGIPAPFNGGAPSVLIGYGKDNAERLESCGIDGKYLPVNYTPLIVVGISPSWFSVVGIAVRHHGDTDLQPIYEMVERIAPDKVQANQHWREKIRQQVRRHRRKREVQGNLFQ